MIFLGLINQGITVDVETKRNAQIMLLTSLVYIIVVFGVLAHPATSLTGFILCSAFLIAYCIYQVFVPSLTEKRLARLEEERKEKRERLMALHVFSSSYQTKETHC